MKWRDLSCQVQNESCCAAANPSAFTPCWILRVQLLFSLSWWLRYCNTRLLLPVSRNFLGLFKLYISREERKLASLPVERLLRVKMAATTSSAKKEGKFIGTLDETPERKFRRARPLIKFSARTKVTQQRVRASKSRGIFCIQPSGDYWQPAPELGSHQKHSQINPIIRISSDGFPRAIWLYKLDRKLLAAEIERCRGPRLESGLKGAGKKRKSQSVFNGCYLSLAGI